MITSQGKNYKTISIQVEHNGEDYFCCVLQVLQELHVKLSGGYYEPMSERDRELSYSIYVLLDKYKVQK